MTDTQFDPLVAKLNELTMKIKALRLVVGNERRVIRREKERRAVLREIQVRDNGTLALGFKTLGAVQLPSCYAPTTTPPQPSTRPQWPVSK